MEPRGATGCVCPQTVGCPEPWPQTLDREAEGSWSFCEQRDLRAQSRAERGWANGLHEGGCKHQDTQDFGRGRGGQRCPFPAPLQGADGILQGKPSWEGQPGGTVRPRVRALGRRQQGGETQVRATEEGVGRMGSGPSSTGLPVPWLWTRDGSRWCPVARGLPGPLEGETESSANLTDETPRGRLRPGPVCASEALKGLEWVSAECALRGR